MKTLKKLTLVFVMSLFACNETDFVSVNEEFEKAQSSVIQNSKETFVPLEKATEVANIFFGKLAVEEGLAPFQKQNIIKSRSSAKTLDDNGNPLMYILNYEGGDLQLLVLQRIIILF